jgi:large subunit ribosomal protein L18
MLTSKEKLARRSRRNRYKLAARRNGLPRLSVFRSNNHIYAQIIDDANRSTLVAASTMDKSMAKAKAKATGNVEAATAVGKMLAERAVSKGVDQVVFDRGGYLFHGRVKAVADAARAAGLKF